MLAQLAILLLIPLSSVQAWEPEFPLWTLARGEVGTGFAMTRQRSHQWNGTRKVKVPEGRAGMNSEARLGPKCCRVPTYRISDTSPSSNSPETFDLSGEWEILEVEEDRTYRAILDRQGNGAYTWQGGQFKTTSFTDRRWRGTWNQTGNDREGEFELVLSEDGTLGKGIWWYVRVGTKNNIPPREHGGSYVWKRLKSSSPVQ